MEMLVASPDWSFTSITERVDMGFIHSFFFSGSLICELFNDIHDGKFKSPFSVNTECIHVSHSLESAIAACL